MNNQILHARWIAPSGEKKENYTFLARKQFSLDRVPASAMLRVCADSRYVLYLNGQFVGVGPARHSHKRYFYDSYDVAKFLCAGKNHLAAEVHCPVKATFIAAPVTPALWLQLDGIVGTDASWQVRVDPSHRSDSLLYTFQVGYSELRDMRKELIGWQTFADGDAGWTAAEKLGGPLDLGGRQLVPRDIPALREEERTPQRLVSSGGVPATEGNIENDVHFADLMHSEMHFRAGLPSFDFQQGVLRIVPSRTGRGGFCILDFEREVVGSVSIDIEAPAGTILDVGYAEALQDNRVYTKRFDYRFADRYILRGGRQRIEHRLHDRGLRFMQLVFRQFQEPVTVHSLRVIDRTYPIPIQATFECDDPFLNQLWQMCVATMSACCTDTFIDSWREQAMWNCDNVVETPFYLSLASDPKLPARCLRLGADGQLPNGLMPAVYPCDRANSVLYPSIPALWTITLSEYYLYTADLALVKELLPAVDKGLGAYEPWRDADGLVPDQKDLYNFIDWGYGADTAGLGGTTAILNMLIAAALQRAAWLHESVGNTGRAAELARKSRDLVAAIVRKFWLVDQSRFYDCTEPPLGQRSFSQHPHGVGLHFGLLDEPQKSTSLETLLDPSLVKAEFYFQHFVLSALARSGRAQQALATIRDLWGEMVRENSPTLWEAKGGPHAFSGCGSLCHGFSSTPLYFMQTTLLGVRPLLPGFKEFTIEPQSLGLRSCRGKIPTPHGVISVAWCGQEGGELSVEADIPGQTSARLADGTRLNPGHHSFRATG